MSERQSLLDEEQIGAMEDRLAGTLKPVAPPRDFVRRLRGHIHLPEQGKIVVHLPDWERLLLAFGSVLSGAVLILTVARALYHLFGRRS